MHTVCSSDTLHVVIMGNKHSSLECQLVFFFSFWFLLHFNEKIMWFFTFFQQYTSKTPKVQCMRACVLPFSWYSLQVLTIREKTNTRTLHINTFTLLRKLVWGSQNGNSQWFYFDTFLFMLPFVCFSIYQVDRINSRSVWFGTQKRAKKHYTIAINIFPHLRWDQIS